MEDNVLTITKLDELIKQLGPIPKPPDITAGWRISYWLEDRCKVETVFGPVLTMHVWIDPTIGPDEHYWGKPNAERLRAILGDAAEGWLAPEDRQTVE